MTHRPTLGDDPFLKRSACPNLLRLNFNAELSQNLSARVEYLFYDFNESTAPAGALAGGTTKLDPSMQTVRFGLNYKF